MDVPEIRAMVALHLCRLSFYDIARHDLTVCARVCRDWHATFMPLLYYFLSLRISHTSRNRKPTPVPPLEVLEANSLLFQELYLALFSTQSPILQLAVAKLRNLKRLRLRAMYMRDEADEIDWLSLRPLLTNNLGIQELSIANIKHPDCLAHVAENCTSSLTSLFLGNMRLDWSQLLPALTQCRLLSNLQCHTCTFNDSKERRNEVVDTASQPATTNITDLQLHLTSGEGKASLVDWVKLCPRLETLSITKERMMRFGPSSQFSPGPQLSSLYLDCRFLKDAELAEVLARCTSLKDLTLLHASITRQVFASLSGQFDSLAYLDIMVQPMIEQWMVKRILEGCPRLVELYLCDMDAEGLYDTALDDQEDLPWASRDSLKNLWMNDMRMSLDGFVNDRFMKQLSNLKQLQKLSIKGIYIGNGTSGILDVPGNTPEALLLSNMCKLVECGISNPDLRDPMTGWLREAWPKLLHFEYVMGDDDDYSE